MINRLTLCLMLGLSACKSPETTPTPASAPTPALAARAPIAAADAQALLDRWLQAQNTSNLAAYSELYATDFFGTKRSGKRTKHFDRAGWLQDRKPNFSKPLTVAASEVEIKTTPDSAEIRFVQDWASSSFRDVEQKVLFLRPENGSLKITKEEMLDSKVLDAKQMEPLKLEDFGFIDFGQSIYLLAEKQTSSSPVDPKLEVHVDALTHAVASQEVADSTLPRELRSWTNRRVRLFEDATPRCEATVVRPVLIARGEFDGDVYYNASEIFTNATVWLAFELHTDHPSSCRGAYWARATDRPVPTLSTGHNRPVTRELDERFMAAKGWRTTNDAFLKTPEARGRWDVHWGAERESAVFEGLPEGDCAWVGAQSGQPDSDWWRGFWGIWCRSTAGWSPVTDEDMAYEIPAKPRVAADLDNDGAPEFITPVSVYRRAGAVWRSDFDSAPSAFYSDI